MGDFRQLDKCAKFLRANRNVLPYTSFVSTEFAGWADELNELLELLKGYDLEHLDALNDAVVDVIDRRLADPSYLQSAIDRLYSTHHAFQRGAPEPSDVSEALKPTGCDTGWRRKRGR